MSHFLTTQMRFFILPRAVPPGGFTSNAFDYQYDGGKKALEKNNHDGSSRHSLNNNNDNVYGYETKTLDNARRVERTTATSNLMRSKEGVGPGEPGSRFAAALEQPVLELTTTERMRTPR